MMARSTFNLFTYGTLRESGPAARLLDGCRRVGTATVRGMLYDVGDYPALLLAGDDRIEGEIWACPVELLPRLDRYEGVNAGLFRRAGLRVEGVPCWVYVAGPALGPRLTGRARIQHAEMVESTWR